METGDKTISVRDANTQKRLKLMPDGTFAEVVTVLFTMDPSEHAQEHAEMGVPVSSKGVLDFAYGPQAPVEAPATSIIATAGNLSGTYYYKATFVTADGETDASTFTGTPISPVSQQVSVTGIPVSTNPLVLKRRLYRNAASALDKINSLQLVAEIADNTTTSFTDNVADASLGAFCPRVNFYAPNQYWGGVLCSSVSIINTVLGYNANATKTGYATTAIGANALASLTSGDRNTGVGVFAGTSLTTGQRNVAIGVHAMNYGTTTLDSVAVGYAALYTNVGSGKNTAVGASALTTFSDATGGGNTAIGYISQNLNASGQNNTSVGDSSLKSLTSGTQNTAIGVESLKTSNGNFNAAFGFQAASAMTSGNYNTAIGYSALNVNAFGSNNIGLGAFAGKYETGSYAIYVDNRDRGSLANAKSLGLFYGVTAATAEGQTLALNAVVKTVTTTVASLPSASAVGIGYRAFVTDATASTFASVVSGGGSTPVPVYSDGTAWRIG